MSTQDCLTYLLEAITLSFAALMFIDFVTGLPLQLLHPVPNPLDMSAVFDAVNSLQECTLLADKLGATAIEDPWTLPTPPCTYPRWSRELREEEFPPQSLISMGLINMVEDTLALPPTPSTAAPDLSSMTREALAEIAKKHGIQHYRKGNRRKTKKELLAELGKLQLA